MTTRKNPKQPEPEAPATTERKSNLLLKARHAAVDRLIDEHNVEFQGYYKEAAAELGVEYTPPLTEEEKAQQQLEAIYAKHPHLRPIPASVTSPGSEPPSPVEAGDLAST